MIFRSSRPRLRYGVIALVACLSAAPAFAETDISGRWLFKTEPLPGKGCSISGDIEFTKTAKPLGYSCIFHSREDCKRAGGDTFTEVRQSCIAMPAGGAFIISSKVEAITDAGPPLFRAQMMAEGSYAADNFRVSPTRAGEMTGLFHSLRQAAVRFWRDEDLVS